MKTALILSALISAFAIVGTTDCEIASSMASAHKPAKLAASAGGQNVR